MLQSQNVLYVEEMKRRTLYFIFILLASCTGTHNRLTKKGCSQASFIPLNAVPWPTKKEQMLQAKSIMPVYQCFRKRLEGEFEEATSQTTEEFSEDLFSDSSVVWQDPGEKK